jgi:RimJ/RimL family protein N-acetyltransferase
MGDYPTISTPRLTLRAPEHPDAGVIASLADDLDVARITTRLPHPYGRADAEAFIAQMRECDLAREVAFVIEDAQAGVVGMIGLHPGGQFGPEIGYWLGRPYWGRGIATEAALAALVWAKDDWGRRVVMSGHFADNPASGRVLEKAGFLYTGEIQPRRSTARAAVAPTRMMVWLA